MEEIKKNEATMLEENPALDEQFETKEIPFEDYEPSNVKKSKKNKKNNAPEFIQEPVQEPVYNNEYVNPNPYAGEEVQNQNVVDQNIVDQNNTFNE